MLIMNIIGGHLPMKRVIKVGIFPRHVIPTEFYLIFFYMDIIAASRLAILISRLVRAGKYGLCVP